MYRNIARYTYIEKLDCVKAAQEIGVVDELIKPLVDEINGIPEFFAFNSCQGGGGKHSSKTYVSFYVINHHYEVAHALIAYIQNKFGCPSLYEDCKAWGEVDFRNDYDLIIDDKGIDWVVPTDRMSLRFELNVESPEVIPQITKVVKEFKEFVLSGE